MEIDVTERVQRLEAFEDRLSVQLEAISAFMSGPDHEGHWQISLCGELHPLSGTAIVSDIELVLSAYDAKGRVVKTDSERFDEEDFFAFGTFSFFMYAPTEVATLRLFPKVR